MTDGGVQPPEGNSDVIPKLELLKLSFDWCKHIASLSTGSILLMVTFREKLTQEPEWRMLLPGALLGFVFAILGTLGVQFEHLRQERYAEPTLLGGISMLFMAGGFLLGIFSLTIFGAVNLW